MHGATEKKSRVNATRAHGRKRTIIHCYRFCNAFCAQKHIRRLQPRCCFPNSIDSGCDDDGGSGGGSSGGDGGGGSGGSSATETVTRTNI